MLDTITKELEKLRKTVKDDNITAIKGQMRMKKLITELFEHLGYSEDDAWLNTYLETGDIDGLRRHMAQPHIVRQFVANQERRNALIAAEAKRRSRSSLEPGPATEACRDSAD